eukprot:CAMPEP_0198342610 /NCGR_PEP_ID=MMETSP1450-20131203/53356_1 /TAXON_ID=753684 ORGANISM="Madagascaria erythrocladiodes, Strain CCMP3234" /NCGR_SAMPLE_ID=MMETSP1450 /ASSEMBLY_ACC=CAM_ASM_001115 /LENGTH=125 /DNA_ID=CAMNT_0044047717 /DNA_START=122 /DNA_END=496 /DNA_ORIENTATION=+
MSLAAFVLSATLVTVLHALPISDSGSAAGIFYASAADHAKTDSESPSRSSTSRRLTSYYAPSYGEENPNQAYYDQFGGGEHHGGGRSVMSSYGAASYGAASTGASYGASTGSGAAASTGYGASSY